MEKKIECVVVGDIQTNCWLYALDDARNSAGQRPCAVIDPGDEAALIISHLKDLNWVPRYILLTHAHFDHLLALPGLLEAFEKGSFREGSSSGPLPKIGIHRLDAEYLEKQALPAADILFEEGDQSGPFRVLHLPGHSPGSAGFYDEKTDVLFSGDTLFRGNYGRTDLPGGNFQQLRQSLNRLLSMNGEIVVCPGHGPATTIKEEAAFGFNY